MVEVVNRGEVFGVRLVCHACGEQCRMDELWLAFPPGEAVRGEWVHRGCLDGRLEAMLGTRRAVLMRGIDALRRIAESLGDVADHPALARQRPRRTAKA